MNIIVICSSSIFKNFKEADENQEFPLGGGKKIPKADK